MATDKSTDEHTSSAPAEATFGMKRAAEVAGVSVSTIRRNKELLRQHGAVLDPDGWKVPMSALIASGLMRRNTPPDQLAPASSTHNTSPEPQMYERLRELEREALEWKHRAELADQRARAAEALADERGRTLEIERRMLTAGPLASPANQPSKSPESESLASSPSLPDTTTSRRSWWRRTFG